MRVFSTNAARKAPDEDVESLAAESGLAVSKSIPYNNIVSKVNYAGDKLFFRGEYDCVGEVALEGCGIQNKNVPLNFQDNPLVVAEKFITRENINRLQYREKVVEIIREQIAIYKPKSDNAMQLDCPVSVFPMKHSEYYEKMNLDGMKGKLEEFQAKLHEEGEICCLTEIEIKYLRSLIEKIREVESKKQAKDFTNNETEVARKLLTWPVEFAVPVLDLWRCILLHYSSQIFFSGVDSGFSIISGIVSKLREGPPAVWLVFPKILSNFFIHTANALSLVRAFDLISEAFKMLKKSDEKVVALYANYLMNCSSAVDDLVTVTDEFVTTAIHQAGDLLVNGNLDAQSTVQLAVSLGNFAVLRPSVSQEAVPFMEELITKLADSPDPTTKSIVESMRILVKS